MHLETQMTLAWLQELLMALRANDADGLAFQAQESANPDNNAQSLK